MLFDLCLKIELCIGLKPNADLELIIKGPIEGAVIEIDSHGFSTVHGNTLKFTFNSVRTDWPFPAQRLAPVRPVSPVGAARTVRAVGADFFGLAQRAKAA